MTEACSEIVRDSVLIPRQINVIILFFLGETTVINSKANFNN